MEDNRRPVRWLAPWHCERRLFPIKVFYFSFIGAFGVVNSYAVVFLKQDGLSPVQIGVIYGIRPLLGFISAPVWGAIADRYNIRRVLMLMSMLAWLAFFSGLYFVESPTRRVACDLDWISTDREDAGELTTATTGATAAYMAPNVSMSGATVNRTVSTSSTAKTTYVANTATLFCLNRYLDLTNDFNYSFYCQDALLYRFTQTTCNST